MTLIILELAGAMGYLCLVDWFLKSRGTSLPGLVRCIFRRSDQRTVSSPTKQPARPVRVNIANCRAQPIGSRRDFAECLMGPFHPCEFAFGVGEVRFCCHPESKKIIAQTRKISVFHPQPDLNGKPHPVPTLVNSAQPCNRPALASPH